MVYSEQTKKVGPLVEGVIMERIEKIINEKRRVRMDDEPGSVHLYTMTNGRQWSSCRVDDIEMASHIRDILIKYIDQELDKRN